MVTWSKVSGPTFGTFVNILNKVQTCLPIHLSKDLPIWLQRCCVSELCPVKKTLLWERSQISLVKLNSLMIHRVSSIHYFSLWQYCSQSGRRAQVHTHTSACTHARWTVAREGRELWRHPSPRLPSLSHHGWLRFFDYCHVLCQPFFPAKVNGMPQGVIRHLGWAHTNIGVLVWTTLTFAFFICKCDSLLSSRPCNEEENAAQLRYNTRAKQEKKEKFYGKRKQRNGWIEIVEGMQNIS